MLVAGELPTDPVRAAPFAGAAPVPYLICQVKPLPLTVFVASPLIMTIALPVLFGVKVQAPPSPIIVNAVLLVPSGLETGPLTDPVAGTRAAGTVPVVIFPPPALVVARTVRPGTTT